ncbi:PAS domain-containing protein [Kiloniella sp. EL199]|uniref:PAS domain-containing protein n=1 Tax=Kiloniella sp. EL199 TaxID=2107581 RepID=UPI0013C3E988|nr:PAS domain-containing protein [Kiloniella sp. EL199]
MARLKKVLEELVSPPLHRVSADISKLKPPLRIFLQYWEDKRRGVNVSAKLPSKDDIDPVDLRALLNKVMLFEVLDGGKDFKIRICGQEVREILTVPVKGELLSDLEKQGVVVADMEAFRFIIASRKPLCEVDRSMAAVGRPHVNFQSVVVPLATDGTSVDFLMGAYVYGEN